MGVFLEKDGVSKRANIVLDGEGTIIFIKTYPIHELPDIEEVIRKLSEQV
jgi:peroxiredoxin